MYQAKSYDTQTESFEIETFTSEVNVLDFEAKAAAAKTKNFTFEHHTPEVLFITSLPPRECGIATYSEDLINTLNNKFGVSFDIKVVALETTTEKHSYSKNVTCTLDTDDACAFADLAERINQNDSIALVLIQHEFGFFRNKESDFKSFLKNLEKPVIIVFHTVLPSPSQLLKSTVKDLIRHAESIIVMTNDSARILEEQYDTPERKISVIAHGTHLVAHPNKTVLKQKYGLEGKMILSTFGLLSAGKSIETTLDALPAIVAENSDVLFLIIGKTHPIVAKNDGESYRNMLISIIESLNLQDNVKFINHFLPLEELLEYLQLTDVYLFTSKDPNQAVSGTFSYAISCGCPIVSTPIPHAVEVLKGDVGIIFDFQDSKQLAQEVNTLLADDKLRKDISLNGLHKTAPNAWENSAIAHALLFQKVANRAVKLNYQVPQVNINHIKRMTTPFGIIQFSVVNQPDIATGYTLDDNARALVAMCQYYELLAQVTDKKLEETTKKAEILSYIVIYVDFIVFCLQDEGYFLNYVDESGQFTQQNSENLADANGRAVWALGYLVGMSDLLPKTLCEKAQTTIQRVLPKAANIHSTRAMAFIIKGMYYANTNNVSVLTAVQNVSFIEHFADKLVQMYRHETEENWTWYESYLTYANSILPESLLCAWLATGNERYRQIAKTSFDFLLSKIFREDSIKVISNKGWLHNGEDLVAEKVGGEQPIDVAYTILALAKFYDAFEDESYLKKLKIAFDWFLGNNHLQQIIYNPCTGGCYDGLEDTYINLNQGAESTVSYLMARLTVEKYLPLLKKQAKREVLVEVW